MDLADSLAYHKERPNVSVDTYVRQLRIGLANGIARAKKVYLDTTFWLLLRNASLGRSHDPVDGELLNLLRSLVAAQRVVCPISATTFTEIFAQTDPITLQASIQLIDELSCGIALIEERERFNVEVFHFVRQRTQGPDGVLPLDSLVWTKLAYVLGFVTPVSKELPADVSLLVQKAFVDRMWTVTLADMLRQMGAAVSSFPRAFKDVSTSLNDGKFANLNEHKSLKQVFLSEVAGILDVLKSDLASLMRHIYEMDTGVALDLDAATDDLARPFMNLIYNAFRLNKLTVELPSIRVSAGLHAAVRWDRSRKYKRNDLHDFHHAVAAIPYCDYFLTEHSLRQLVTHKGVQFTQLFRCQSFSTAEESVKALGQIGT
jgi:hypothetical protein